MTDAAAALAAVAAEIARLRADYQARLPAELAAMTEAAAGLHGNADDLPALADLRHRLHKLAGSCGTFGLSALGEHARALEHIADRWLDASQPRPDAAALQSFKDGTAALPSHLATTDSPAAAATGTAPAAASGPTSRIWLVEQEGRTGRMLEDALVQFGYEVRAFAGIDAARQAAAAAMPDVLIVDTAASGNQLAGMEVQPLACPLLLLSDTDGLPARARAARLGAAAFLVKPVDATRLVDHIERILEERRAPPYRVLIVDDDVDLSTHFRLVLAAAGMDADVLNDPECIIERVADFQPELILMDVNMPVHTGPELATVIRHHDEWVGLPIVYLSAVTDLDKQLEALGRGADDFITKPISDVQLVAAVRARAARSRQLADLMSKDSLTGLLKHSRIKEQLEAEFSRAQRRATPLSVVMADIDHFKSVNDTYGHGMGDRVIKAVAHLLRQRLRKSDIVGRYGGEEFAVVLPECDEAMAHRILEDIRIRFAALRFRHEGQEFACTLSAGIACTTRCRCESGGELLTAADKALYTAKHGGRNQVRCAPG